MCCRRNPNLRATILDFPNALDVAREFVGDVQLADRVEYVAANAFEESWPEGHDVVLMSYLMSAVAGDAIGALLERSFAALPAGGLLLVHDFMVDDELGGPTDAAMWFLTCMFNRADARVLTPNLISEQTTAAGFIDVEVQHLIPDLTRVITANKPR